MIRERMFPEYKNLKGARSEFPKMRPHEKEVEETCI